MERKLVLTDDGSHSLFAPEILEYYHSHFGAVQESRHIFIERAFLARAGDKKVSRVLEIGFGTGLNAFLTLAVCHDRKYHVHYTALEPSPLDISLIARLNYPEIVGFKGSATAFRQMHLAPWDEESSLSEYFKLIKVKLKVEQAELPDNQYDVVYFDAFGPEAQPELWTVDIFNKLFVSMDAGGVLITFSAKGSVKRALKQAGFEIELLGGPPGKRAITRAWKN